MITPSCDEILELAKEYTTIPVCREIYADMTTPISLLRRLQMRSDRFFLLESVEGGEKWARYSFLGYDPILRATCKNGTVTLEGTVNKTVKTDKPLPKEKMFECMHLLDSITAKSPVRIGDRLAEHILGTDVNIVATKAL